MSKTDHCPREAEPVQNNPDIKNPTAPDTSSPEGNLSSKKSHFGHFKKINDPTDSRIKKKDQLKRDQTSHHVSQE